VSSQARGIALGLGDYGTLVKDYFKANPCPPRDLRVDRVDVIDQGGLTFIDLLQAIIRASGVKDFVLVVHGHPSGLALSLGPGGANCNGQHLQTLMDIERSIELERPGERLTDAQRAQQSRLNARRAELRLSDQVINQLIDLMRRVRAMRLNRVEWRSCNLGKKPDVLTQFLEPIRQMHSVSFGA